MAGINLPPVGDLDVEDLLTLPKGYRYELHEGNLVIMTPVTFWRREIAHRVRDMLMGAGRTAFLDPGVLGDRPRDCRLPDVGVMATELPPGKRFVIIHRLESFGGKPVYGCERSLLLSELEAECEAKAKNL